jgi:hypothetical protein
VGRSVDARARAHGHKRTPTRPLCPQQLTRHPYTRTQVTEGLPIEPVRHFRVGGYAWGDMSQVADKVPEAIRKYYNLK